jgi:hypothetical protein
LLPLALALLMQATVPARAVDGKRNPLPVLLISGRGFYLFSAFCEVHNVVIQNRAQAFFFYVAAIHGFVTFFKIFCGDFAQLFTAAKKGVFQNFDIVRVQVHCDFHGLLLSVGGGSVTGPRGPRRLIPFCRAGDRLSRAARSAVHFTLDRRSQAWPSRPQAASPLGRGPLKIALHRG